MRAAVRPDLPPSGEVRPRGGKGAQGRWPWASAPHPRLRRVLPREGGDLGGVLTLLALILALFATPAFAHTKSETHSVWRVVGNVVHITFSVPDIEAKRLANPDGSPGQGQACKELRQMLFLLPGQTLPHHLNVQPTSLQYFSKYSLNLLYAGAPYWSVVTKIGLEVGPTASGQSVARITFQLAKRLNQEERQSLEPYHQRMREFLTPMIVEADAYEIEAPTRAQSNPDDVPF